jgi:hypothetical protein
MRLLLAAALAAAAILPAGAAAAPRHLAKPATVSRVTAEHAAQGRHVSVTLRGHARAVIVCDLAPVVCAVAQRHGRQWDAVLPDGPVALGLVGSGIRVQQPTAVAGGGASFHVAVYAFSRRGTTRTELRGRYRAA